MPAIIKYLRAAPLITRQEQVTFYMEGEGSTCTGSSSSRGVCVFVVNALQLIDRRQSPVEVSGQAEIAAVLHRTFPAHVFSVVLRGPHESGGRISPILAYLSLLLHTLVIRRRLRSCVYGRKRKKNENNFCRVVHLSEPRTHSARFAVENHSSSPLNTRPWLKSKRDAYPSACPRSSSICVLLH